MNEKLVVIIDDDRGFVLALSKFLLRRGFGAIGTCRGHDGLASLASLENGGASVAVIDLHLPDISGIEVVERLRATGRHTPCILISADDRPEVPGRCLSAGAFRFMAKPLEPGDLLRTITDALDPGRPEHHASPVREHPGDLPLQGR